MQPWHQNQDEEEFGVDTRHILQIILNLKLPTKNARDVYDRLLNTAVVSELLLDKE